jgi:hypothetical protein
MDVRSKSDAGQSSSREPLAERRKMIDAYLIFDVSWKKGSMLGLPSTTRQYRDENHATLFASVIVTAYLTKPNLFGFG